LLWRASVNIEQEQFAAWIARKTDWCWKQFIECGHPLIGWAIETLRPWVTGGDNAPEYLKGIAK
jgi:hypothetical protein